MLTFLLVIEDAETRTKLEQLYKLYHKEMYLVAYRILNNSQDAQDVAHTSVIKLEKYLEKIQDIYCNKTQYLIVTIVRNTAIDLYRRKKRYLSAQLEDISDIV